MRTIQITHQMIKQNNKQHTRTTMLFLIALVGFSILNNYITNTDKARVTNDDYIDNIEIYAQSNSVTMSPHFIEGFNSFRKKVKEFHSNKIKSTTSNSYHIPCIYYYRRIEKKRNINKYKELISSMVLQKDTITNKNTNITLIIDINYKNGEKDFFYLFNNFKNTVYFASKDSSFVQKLSTDNKLIAYVKKDIKKCDIRNEL